MKYELQITYDDYKAACWLNMGAQRLLGVGRYPSLVAVLLLCLLPIGRFLTEGNEEALHWFAGLAGLAAFLLMLRAVVLSYKIKTSYKQHKLIHKPLQYEFTADAFSISAEYGSSTIPWNDFHTWREGKTLFLVCQTDCLFHLIPKRIFESPEAEKQFRDLLADKIGKPGK